MAKRGHSVFLQNAETIIISGSVFDRIVENGATCGGHGRFNQIYELIPIVADAPCLPLITADILLLLRHSPPPNALDTKEMRSIGHIRDSAHSVIC
ncbi:hypothetical protein P4E94_09865 [Pontiellaceae bacterium B12219]|nr:hypothetical protein [Pontiellaceae bacterium B12219]